MGTTFCLGAVQLHARLVPSGVAPLRYGIRDVVGLRADSKVRGIDAAWGVAGVQDDATGWDWTERYFVGEAMSELANQIASGRRPAGNLDVAVRERVPVYQPAGWPTNDASRQLLGEGIMAVPAPAQPHLGHVRNGLRVRFRRVTVTYIIRTNAIQRRCGQPPVINHYSKSRFLTHAAPITISNGTPVVWLIAMPTLGLGAVRFSSSLAYLDCEQPRNAAASRWLNPRAARQCFRDG